MVRLLLLVRGINVAQFVLYGSVDNADGNAGDDGTMRGRDGNTGKFLTAAMACCCFC